MKTATRIVTVLTWSLLSIVTKAQCQTNVAAIAIADTLTKKPVNAPEAENQLDLIDVVREIAHKGAVKRVDTGEYKSTKLHISGVPAAGYTLQTGFAGLVTANAAFCTDTDANTSIILTSFTYTVRNQIILPLQTTFWTRNNRYIITTDWRYLKFPSYTYGLGGNTSLDDGYLIDYSALRLHQTLLRKIGFDMYAGIGYNLDYFWGVEELDPPANKVTDFQRYGLNKTEFASGFTFNYLYDTRANPINPERGSFVNLIYRPNLVVFGNTATWRSFVIDARKYIRFPASSNNVLAFWTYEWLTVSGKPPYLMMPNTGGDPYSNTGRGYIQGRYRGKNMAYVEGEYRFGITNNGLLGGVVFANAESFTKDLTPKFVTVEPAVGAGIRIKLNKFSRTNVAIDYGFGVGGSGGLFVNLGEVF